MPSTKLVLSALQKAFAARQRIQARCSPVKEADILLYDQSAGPQLQPGYKRCSLLVDWALPSPCGSYIAVVLVGRQEPLDHERYRRWLHVYDVCLHSTSEGLPEVARFHTTNAEPELKWSPAGQLCIAQSCCRSAAFSLQCSVDLHIQASNSAKCSALIWDPKLAAVVHRVGPDVSALLHKPEPRYRTEDVNWATSCQYLLAQGSLGTDEDYNEECGLFHGKVSGWLVIADVVQCKVGAKSRVHSTVGRSNDNPFAILWVPYARAVILQSYTQVEDLPSLAQAGFAVGNLPMGTEKAGGFSPTAEFLAVRYSRSDREEVQLLSCSIVGPHVCLKWSRDSSAAASLAQSSSLAGCQNLPFYACSVTKSLCCMTMRSNPVLKSLILETGNATGCHTLAVLPSYQVGTGMTWPSSA